MLALPGVVGVGEGDCDGAPCIVVMAAAESAPLRGRLPRTLDGYPVRLRVTGEVQARRPSP